MERHEAHVQHPASHTGQHLSHGTYIGSAGTLLNSRGVAEPPPRQTRFTKVVL